MPNAAQLKFNEIDESFFVDSPIAGLAAVSVRTKRGPWGHDGTVTNSWPEFVKKYGGEVSTLEGPTQVRRAFERGAKLRINKMGHYTSAANPATLDAVRAAADETGASLGVMGADDLFDLIIKYQGADYNNLTIQILAASNGDANSFNIAITHALEPDLNELYENLLIVGKPTVAASTYLDVITAQSKLVTVNYENISAAASAAPIRPVNGTWAVTGGTDGTAPADADYTGDSAGKTGWHAFNDFEDFDFLAALDRDTQAVLTSGNAYTKARADHRFIAHLPNSAATVAALIAARAATTSDNRYGYFIAGGLKIANPFIDSQNPLSIAEIGDVVGAACKTSAELGPWRSFAGTTQGTIDNVSGVVNNFITLADLNALANRQVNVVIAKGGSIYIKGNFSAQLATSRKSYSNVVGLIIYIKKALAPVMDRYLEQPCDFRMFKDVYNEVFPFLEGLKGGDKRALKDYEWKGDQFANTDSELVVNNPTDLGLGKYRVKLWLKEIVSLQEFTIDIISANSAVQFEDDF